MRILGITIPDQKHLEIGLTALFGIGRPRARQILAEAGVPATKKAAEVNAEEEKAILELIEGLRIEGDLRREIGANIKRLKDIKSYRGTRHARRLPVRGQNTKRNTRTVRGNKRVTMGSGKKKADKK
jgi:small subunit ribosomal protein S13